MPSNNMEHIEFRDKHLVLVYFTPKELEALIEYSNHNKTSLARVCRDNVLDILHVSGYLEDKGDEPSPKKRHKKEE